MPELTLTQAEADLLIAMKKHAVDENEWQHPQFGGSICVPLTSADHRESFLLDISRGRIDLQKGKYQDRARNVIVLVRLDFGGQPHRNPDGVEVASPHLHVYREGYGDKWALPIPAESFSNPSDRWRTLEEFMAFCRITRPPRINGGLFA